MQEASQPARLRAAMSPEVHPQPTPNPNALKFHLPRLLLASGSRWYPDAAAARAAEDPLALALFALPGVTHVFMLRDFVTLGKSADADWEQLAPAAVRLLADHLARTDPEPPAGPGAHLP